MKLLTYERAQKLGKVTLKESACQVEKKFAREHATRQIVVHTVYVSTNGSQLMGNDGTNRSESVVSGFCQDKLG